MTFSVENWSNYSVSGRLFAQQSDYAVVDNDKSVITMDGKIEFELLCRCPTKEKAVWLTQLLNRKA